MTAAVPTASPAMARVLFAAALLLAALAQAALLPASGAMVLPNLVLVLLLVRGALRGVGEVLLWIAGAGLLLDVLALDPIGLNGLALLPVGVIGALARRRFFQSGVLFPMLLAVGATVAHAIVLAGLRAVLGDGAIPLPGAGRLVLLQALLNALLVPPAYWLVAWLHRMEPEGR